jgi:hypothetical protein
MRGVLAYRLNQGAPPKLEVTALSELPKFLARHCPTAYKYLISHADFRRKIMKSNLATLFAIVIGVAIGAHAQAAVEYSHTAAGSAGAVAAASKTLGTAGNRVAGKLAAAGKNSGNASSANTVAVTNVPAPKANGAGADPKAITAQPSGPRPDPSAVFILSNGEKIESRSYFLTVDSVRIDDSDMPRTIPMSTLNVDATLAANRQRGLNLKIPDNKAQIMVSF